MLETKTYIVGKLIERIIGFSRPFIVPPLQVWDVIGRSVVVAEGRDDLGLGGDLKSKVGYLRGIAVTFLMTF